MINIFSGKSHSHLARSTCDLLFRWHFDSGKNKQEHDQRLEQVLQCLKYISSNLFSQTEVEYLGHCVDSTGIHPTEKVKAIKDAPVPTDASQLRAFIGLMNYYGKFIPHISTQLASLYELLEKDQIRTWSEECEATFCKCQALLTCDAVLVIMILSCPLS